MSKVEQLYQRHLDSLREKATKKNIPFVDALMAVYSPLEKNALITLFLGGKGTPEAESYLIARYRSEFFEWIANNAIDINQSAIEAMANNKATEIISNARKQIAKNAADAGHGQPGGSRDKRAKLLEIYLRDYKPKDKTKTDCIDKERIKLGMSQSTGEKALRNK